MKTWNHYYEALSELSEKGCIELPYIPPHCTHNAHMFYIKTKDLDERTALIASMREKGIRPVFHYIPLHSSDAGKQFSRFSFDDKYTTTESERLLRLPLYYNMKPEDTQKVIQAITEFYN